MIDANLMCSFTLLIFLIRGKRMLYLLQRKWDGLRYSAVFSWLQNPDYFLEIWVSVDTKGERNLFGFLFQLCFPSALRGAPYGNVPFRIWDSSISFSLVL